MNSEEEKEKKEEKEEKGKKEEKEEKEKKEKKAVRIIRTDYGDNDTILPVSDKGESEIIKEAKSLLKEMKNYWRAWAGLWGLLGIIFLGVTFTILIGYVAGILVAFIIILYIGETNIGLSKYSWFYVYAYYRSNKKIKNIS
jgi:hypothetical protein